MEGKFYRKKSHGLVLSRSYAFLAELLLMLLFFLLAGAITLQVFVHAHTVSLHAADKEAALQMAQNAAEAAKAQASDLTALALLLDGEAENGQIVAFANGLRLSLVVEQQPMESGTLYTAEILVEDAKGQVLAETKALRYE